MSEEGGVGGGHFLLYVSALKEAHCGKGKVTRRAKVVHYHLPYKQKLY